MEDCDYCGASFDDEAAYLEHLGSEHEGELSRIDEKRVAQSRGGAGDGVGSTNVLLGVGALLVLGGIVYFAFLSGGSGGGASGPMSDSVQAPSNVGGPHYHGTMTVTIDGEQLDFSQQRYQLQADAFHFESGNGERWHGHADTVTLEFALESLGIGVTDEALSFEGTVYNSSEGDTVVYRVNGEEIDPETYVLQEGDDIEVIANESSS